MKRIALLAALALAAAGSAGAAEPQRVFAVVPAAPAALPSAEVPNDGSLVLPPNFTSHPGVVETRSFEQLRWLWEAAGAAYGIPWPVLAAINKIESNFGQNMGPSSAGAVGWMQFMPETWLRWGMDASGDGVADPWNPEDAIYAAARYLAAAGGRTDLQRGVFAYNHAQWYVDDVLELAQVYARGGVDVSVGAAAPDVHVAEAALSSTSVAIERALAAQERFRRVEARLLRKAERAKLLSDRLALQRRATLAGIAAAEAAAEAGRLRTQLSAAQAALQAGHSDASPAFFGNGAAILSAPPTGSAGYYFPVGGGPDIVSVGRDHHDYPAADIAAPSGSPVYALADAEILSAWPVSVGNCGIGLSLRTGDGRSWTYCHLSQLEPSVQPGVRVAGGSLLGLVGSTGRSTGPHLHLQLNPAASYPQQEAWFDAFAGSAFSWQGEGRALSSATNRHVFAVAEDADPAVQVVRFTR